MSRNDGLPVGPLVEMVDRMLSRAYDTDSVLERLDINPRQLYRMRRGQVTVEHEFADRVLLNSPYLWFDVWQECVLHDSSTVTPECVRCVGHHRAALVFTGAPLPPALVPPEPSWKAERRLKIVRVCQNPQCGAVLPRCSLRYCTECRVMIGTVRRSLVEGMWADGWYAREMGAAIGVNDSYFGTRRRADGWDLPVRYAHGIRKSQVAA